MTHQWKTANLSESRCFFAATAVGNLALFGGGYNETGDVSDRVDIFNLTSGNWTVAALSQQRNLLVAASVGDLAFFAGGVSDVGFSAQVDYYNITSGKWNTTQLSSARVNLAATGVGNMVIFAGGKNLSTSQSDQGDIFICNDPFCIIAGTTGLLTTATTAQLTTGTTGQLTTATTVQLTTAGTAQLTTATTVQLTTATTGQITTATTGQITTATTGQITTGTKRNENQVSASSQKQKLVFFICEPTQEVLHRTILSWTVHDGQHTMQATRRLSSPLRLDRSLLTVDISSLHLT